MFSSVVQYYTVPSPGAFLDNSYTCFFWVSRVPGYLPKSTTTLLHGFLGVA